jgi:23S rRNA (pseudouridine1915-N3)-methyltransferase
MRFLIVAVGHRQPGWVDNAFGEYTKRMPREARVELIEIRPEPRADASTESAIARVLQREAVRIASAVPPGTAIVALDESGESVTTRALAARMEQWFAGGSDVAFLIGSADGLDANLKAGAQRRLSLSPLTLPHGLARVLLAEQLYRAHSVLRGHPYHRD